MRAMSGAIAAALLLAGSGMALGGDIAGTWLTEEGASKVRLEPCGSVLCGKLVWLREPNDPKSGAPILDKNNPDKALRARPLLGLTLISAITPGDEESEWKARAYNAEDGKTYDVTLKLQEDGTLELEGCGLAGLVCQGETWTRAPE